MVDNGALFGVIGELKLILHRKRLVGVQIIFKNIPPDLGNAQFPQFGAGNHASPRRQILGSVNLHILT